ncbi:hypothetical protein TH53_07310 [Pedobacter lusitanus]|uniref:YCII-related domain-containing protein n=1 Tax=Pedobacter lusitanus TaxID=1503925 RepID=A0A0D0GNJ1_9SPHI|nr:YciI family protein [Pedobacter lusitanus]KIO77735.1 hypothetical protein TH53_07310 [Pedobacter lusitanus]
MTKFLLTTAACLLSLSIFAQDQTQPKKQIQYLLIIRSKVDAKPAQDKIQTNIKHWQEYMGTLAKEGKIAGGYRPGTEGTTWSGTEKTISNGAYTANNEVVSSILIINAADDKEIREIAAKCPVFELQGSVEIRPIQNTAR